MYAKKSFFFFFLIFLNILLWFLGFCVARTKDVIDLALKTKEKGSGSSIQELSIVDVPLSGNVRILSLSFDNSTLAVSVAQDIHFFNVGSLIDDKVRF